MVRGALLHTVQRCDHTPAHPPPVRKQALQQMAAASRAMCEWACSSTIIGQLLADSQLAVAQLGYVGCAVAALRLRPGPAVTALQCKSFGVWAAGGE